MTYNYHYIDKSLLAKTKDKCELKLLKDLQLSISTYSNAIILPTKYLDGEIGGGIISDKGEFIPNSSVHENVGCIYTFENKHIKKSDKKVIFIGLINPCWGHFITDGLKKIWYVLENQNEYELVYTTTNNKPLPSNLLSVYEILGIDKNRIIHINEITKFSTIIVPNNSLVLENNGRFYDIKFKKTIDRIKDSVNFHNTSYDKVYFSRSQLKSKKDWGEHLIENEFRKKGYYIFYPEKMTLVEQIAILQNCKTLATTEGSISHNAMFMNKNANLILLRKAPFINSYQLVVNQLQDLNVTIIDCNLSIFAQYQQEWNGPFFIYCNSNLCSFLDIKYKPFPLNIFIKYFIYCIKSGIIYRNFIKKHNKVFQLFRTIKKLGF